MPAPPLFPILLATSQQQLLEMPSQAAVAATRSMEMQYSECEGQRPVVVIILKCLVFQDEKLYFLMEDPFKLQKSVAKL